MRKFFLVLLFIIFYFFNNAKSDIYSDFKNNCDAHNGQVTVIEFSYNNTAYKQYICTILVGHFVKVDYGPLIWTGTAMPVIGDVLYNSGLYIAIDEAVMNYLTNRGYDPGPCGTYTDMWYYEFSRRKCGVVSYNTNTYATSLIPCDGSSTCVKRFSVCYTLQPGGGKVYSHEVVDQQVIGTDNCPVITALSMHLATGSTSIMETDCFSIGCN